MAVATPLVTVRDLAVGYDADPVLEDVTFELLAGQIVGVLGANGTGKTTLFRALLGELRPHSGSVTIGGRIGVVAQTERSRLDLPVTASDVVLLGTITRRPWWRHAGRADRVVADDALRKVGLFEHRRTGFGDLSGGQRQRVLIARTLAQQPRILLLDEPFTGLDAASASALTQLLAELAADGRGLMIATHDIPQAATWDRMLILDHEKAAFGNPEATLAVAGLGSDR
jgi:ABC-type Mn2+/Zn2+ transport system ATPase subunit